MSSPCWRRSKKNGDASSNPVEMSRATQALADAITSASENTVRGARRIIFPAPIDERWEAVYLIDGALYKTVVFATRVLAEHDLMRTKDALETTGWQQSRPPEKPEGGN